MYSRIKLLMTLLLLVLSSCSAGNNDPLQIDQIRPTGKSPNEETIEVSKALYQQVIRGGGSYTKARMVEVFSRGAASGIKEYRLFGVQPGSVYDLLGLQNVDVIVAANGYIIPDQDVFWKYLQIITTQPDAFIEIKRGGRAILLRYKFKE